MEPRGDCTASPSESLLSYLDEAYSALASTHLPLVGAGTGERVWIGPLAARSSSPHRWVIVNCKGCNGPPTPFAMWTRWRTCRGTCARRAAAEKLAALRRTWASVGLVLHPDQLYFATGVSKSCHCQSSQGIDQLLPLVAVALLRLLLPLLRKQVGMLGRRQQGTFGFPADPADQNVAETQVQPFLAGPPDLS
jgi:hypothetical protein